MAFIRETLLFEPWNYAKGTPKRGEIWKGIASSLNQLTTLHFKIDDRAARDRINRLEKNYIKNRNDLDRASGAEVEQEDELQIGIAEIIQLLHESDLKQAAEKEKKKVGVEKELADAEEFRLQSLETNGETRKRKVEDASGSNKGGKGRRKSEDTFDYLREKNTQELDFRKEELAFKTAELEQRKIESQTFKDMLLQQQQQNAALMQQQQQVNVALLQFLTKK